MVNPSLFYHHIGVIYHRSSEIGRKRPDDGAELADGKSTDNQATIRFNPSIRQDQEVKTDAVYEPGAGGHVSDAQSIENRSRSPLEYSGR
jgi:hypothetical protein